MDEWMRDLVRNVGDKAVADIVSDFRRSPPSSGGSTNVQIVGAGKTVDPDPGAKYRAYQPHPEDTADRSGWRAAEGLRPPPGVALVDELVMAQDLRDLEARCREQAATMGLSYPDWLRLMEKDLRDRKSQKEKAAKDRKETPK
jgi:hypothetical protein